MKKSISIFGLFCLINFMLIGPDGLQTPFYALETILIPIEEGHIIFFDFLMNLFFIMIYSVSIIKILNQLFIMHPFIFSRNKREKVAIVYLKKISTTTLKILCLKAIADLITGQMVAITNLDVFMKLYLSSFFTLFLWILGITILYLIFQRQKEVQFISLTFLFIIQYLALHSWFFSLFVIAGVDFYTHFYILMVLKLVLILILFYWVMFCFKHSDVYGGDKND